MTKGICKKPFECAERTSLSFKQCFGHLVQGKRFKGGSAIPYSERRGWYDEKHPSRFAFGAQLGRVSKENQQHIVAFIHPNPETKRTILGVVWRWPPKIAIKGLVPITIGSAPVCACLVYLNYPLEALTTYIPRLTLVNDQLHSDTLAVVI